LRSDNWSELRIANFTHPPNTKREDAKHANRAQCRRLTLRLRSQMSFAGGHALLLASTCRRRALTNQGKVEFFSLRCLSDLGVSAVSPGWVGSNPQSRIPSPQTGWVGGFHISHFTFHIRFGNGYGNGYGTTPSTPSTPSSPLERRYEFVNKSTASCEPPVTTA